MGYQDSFDGQSPPWDAADYSGYRGTGGFSGASSASRHGRYTGPRASAFQPAPDAFEHDGYRRDGIRRDDFQRDDFRPDDFQRDESRARRGDYDTSVDGFRPIGGATIGGRGLLAGGTAGFLAAALALGVANLAAAFVRPQASPIIAVGGDFIDRTPPALKNFAVAKFGENDKTMLLLGMYATIALIAILVGMIAWRQAWAGVVGIGAFGAFGAFVAYTRPDSHSTDVIPSLAGGVVGMVAIILLTRWTRQRAGAAPETYAGWES